MLFDFLIVIGSALAILAIAELVIRLSLRLARHYGLSGSFVGLTILSIGTSLLEITTHVVGSIRILRDPQAMNTVSGLLLGSNIGSDIFQQNVVLPVVGLIGTIVIVRRKLLLEVGALIAASVLLWLACLGGAVTRLEGLLLVAAYAAYLGLLGSDEKHAAGARHHDRPKSRTAPAVALIVACFAAMAMVAAPMLAAAERLVAVLPMSASLFGVLVLGVCAALPELTTSLVAIVKGQREISAGILIGSNVTNPLLGAGLGALISGYSVPAVIVTYDLPAKVLTAALLYLFLRRREDLSRGEAFVLLASYFGYLLLRGPIAPSDF